jgi:uncharacterized lipoprotein NlpE involved in copper resistance
MKRFLLTAVLAFLSVCGFAQLNNNWIHYSNTYYKFYVAKDTLCRISQPTLAAAGLGSVPAQNFQLWRNGKEVRLYISAPSGILSAADYIEFWGQMNDGKADAELYSKPENQLDDKYNLFTDTATYYLTVNAAGNNLRYATGANPVSGTTLTPDAYFMRRVEAHFKSYLNAGYARTLGTEDVYSSSYEQNEGWTSNDIFSCCHLSNLFSGLNKYNAGPANSVTFSVSAAGASPLFTRELTAKVYNTVVIPQPGQIAPMPYYGTRRDTIRNLPLSILESPTFLPVSAGPKNSSNPGDDHIVVSNFSVTYPATFNFNNESNFYFELKASAAGNYLVVTNFNNGGTDPVLYDLNNGLRYTGNTAVAGQVRFVLPPSADTVRRFNLISTAAENVRAVTQLTSKTFLNLTSTANQGDYIIISNPALYDNGSGVNYVEQYRQYRSSVDGGGYNAKVYDINELKEQFAFGIKLHPAAVRDFVRWASTNFAVKPKFVFLIGRAVTYYSYKNNEYNGNVYNTDLDKLNMVPTFGWPASDVMLVCNPGTYIPLAPVGRLGAVAGNEVGAYLQKMKQYEDAQRSSIQTINNKAWMKNMIHISGGGDSVETVSFKAKLDNYKAIAEDTLYGAHVETFIKSSSGPVQEASSNRINDLFKEGLSFINYFGHSSSNILGFNLSNPQDYQNQGKYPFILVNGCLAGNFFEYDGQRIFGNKSLSEKYIFEPQKGSIAFFADSHFGIEPFLDYYNNAFYKEFCRKNYGGTVGDQIKTVLQQFGSNPQSLDYFLRIHLEELTLHGDPALHLNNYAKPDYVIEEQLIKISPSIISVADNNFNLKVSMLNVGRAINDSIRVTVKRKLPNDSIKVLYNQRMPAIKYSDSLAFTVPINPVTDKGLNTILVSLDTENKIAELSETNNSTEKQFYIYEDEIRPVYPGNFSIVRQQNISYAASTANPLVQQRTYTMEIDTTEFFNSAFKKTYTLNGNGGAIEFKPTNITFTDSTVYYWRTSIVPVGSNNIIWNTSSFIYLPASANGWNQSHLYQHFKSSFTDIILDSASRIFSFKARTSTIISNNGNYPTSLEQVADFNLQINGAQYIEDICGYAPYPNRLLIFYLFNPASLDPVKNAPYGTPGLWGSSNCNKAGTEYNFEFDYGSPDAAGALKRKKIMDFMDSIPNGYYVVVKNLTFDTSRYPAPTFYSFANQWRNDGPAGTTLRDKFYNNGFALVDSFNTSKSFTFVYKKNDASYTPNYGITANAYQRLSYQFNIFGRHAEGTITSPVFGPSKKWEALHWRGSSIETPTADIAVIKVYGITNTGTSTLLKTITAARDTVLDFIDAAQYPYIQLQYYTSDFSVATPYQLRYLRINGQAVPEGAVAPNILYSFKDTTEQGELITFKMAFKNISPTAFDSAMKFKLTITDNNNIPHAITLPKGKVLAAGDSLSVQYTIDTKNYPGNNTLFLDVNPNSDQPELVHYNNILFKDFYVKPDNYNPLLDVTFDGVHILNRDIVSSKPHIFIKLKDESRFMALSDTALLKVQIIFPDNSVHTYNFGDSMRFNPANLATGDNSASIDLMPYFKQDGSYQLIVSGKDVVGNKAGTLEYKVNFEVINKPMISNLLNYPNPFTTSTAFVFTLTGSELPQNMRIQILTITGKVVREITKDELGAIHIGRNITDFKWDGTDMYGQKLANGVYLYRVLTNLDGKALDRYQSKGDKTDKYFTKGYGKMVLIR